MGLGVGHPSLALYRLIRAGEAGVNLSLADLFGKTYILPSMFDLVRSFFTRKPIEIKLKPEPQDTIRSLEAVQQYVDKKIKEKLEEAERKTK